MKSFQIFAITLVIILSIFGCRKDTDNQNTKPPVKTETPKLGEVDFKVTGDEAAQPYFKKGLLLLHSFEYEDARAEFLKAQELDSTFAMAYWGEAMTFNHSLWQRQKQEEGVAALNKLAANPIERMELVKTPLEKDFFQAIELLYGDGTKYERDVAYKNKMERLVKKYPGNHEVSAFYAISLLGASRSGRDEELYAKSAQIAQDIIKENANHPGALHYLIHSFDDPEHAHLASFAADAYSKVAPDAAHALHMPSHIYVALGKWNEVVTSNIASWNASVKRMKDKDLDNDAQSYHALNWLQYGLYQKGNIDLGNKLLEKMIQYQKDTDSKSARGYLIAMKAGHLIETNSWDSPLVDLEIKTDDLNIMTKGAFDFLDGMQAYHQQNATALNTVITKVEKRRKKAEVKLGNQNFAMCNAGGYANKLPSRLDIDMYKIMELELKAYEATLNKDFKLAEKHLKKATALDDTLKYAFGPPRIVKPVHEAYGEWLLTQDRPKEALEMFEKSLKRYPGRLLSLQGGKAAATLAKDEKALNRMNKELSISTLEMEYATIN